MKRYDMPAVCTNSDEMQESDNGKWVFFDDIPGWISVDDRLPDDDAWYLVYHSRTIYKARSVSLFGSTEWVGASCHVVHGITHWQPLPSPPGV